MNADELREGRVAEEMSQLPQNGHDPTIDESVWDFAFDLPIEGEEIVEEAIELPARGERIA